MARSVIKTTARDEITAPLSLTALETLLAGALQPGASPFVLIEDPSGGEAHLVNVNEIVSIKGPISG